MTTAGLLNTAISGSNVQNNSFRYKDAVTSFFRSGQVRSGQVRSGVVGVLILNMYLLFLKKIFFFYFETKIFFLEIYCPSSHFYFFWLIYASGNVVSFFFFKIRAHLYRTLTVRKYYFLTSDSIAIFSNYFQ
jgi:hypothetical protein